jgi:hypothetical protein
MRLHATKLGSIANSRGFGDQLFDLAGQVPNLDLNFAGTKTLDPRVTFTRASTGTYVGGDGVLRSAVTNLATRSEEFENAVWTKGGITVTANNSVAPTGATVADSLMETAITSDHVLFFTNTQTFTPATQSIYVKPNGRNNVSLRFIFGASDWVATVFDLTGGGSITQSSAGASSLFTAVSRTIVNAGNGWYRISMTATQPSRASYAFALDFCTSPTPTLNAASGTESYFGDITKGVFVWGAQLETGSIPTSYIPTVASTVTRAAEVATLTGTNFSSWYNASAGTIYTLARGPAVLGGSQPNIWAFDDTPSTDYMIGRVTGTGTTATFFVSVSGSIVATIVSPTFTLKSTFAQASAYALNDFASTVNGGAVGTDTLGAVPVVNKASLGARSTNFLNGTIARFTYYPTRLSNNVLQALTVP